MQFYLKPFAGKLLSRYACFLIQHFQEVPAEVKTSLKNSRFCFPVSDGIDCSQSSIFRHWIVDNSPAAILSTEYTKCLA